MNHTIKLSSVLVVVAGFLVGYALGPGPSIVAQRGAAALPGPAPDQTGALSQVNGVHQPPEFKSTVPAPQLPHGAMTMWPNQPNEATFWSIDDIRKAHKMLADAERAGKTLDPNTTLHSFPYWTRTHAMFIYHVPQNAVDRAAQQHRGCAQFIVIMGGTGTVTAGGQLVRPITLRERDRQIPGELQGRTISGGETFGVKEGDWVSIPPNVPGQFTADSPGGMTYMVMKINAQLYPWDLIR